MKPVAFSLHARKRLAARGISLDEARRVVRTPDRLLRSRSGRFKAMKKVGSRTVHIVYGEGETLIVVITGYVK